MADRTLPVRFDEDGWKQDLDHATSPAVRAAEDARERLEQQGVALSELRPCDPDARDQTQLARCAKVYLPPPNGPWGMVFHIGRRDGALTATVLAFGQRHPRHVWQPSVYRVAHLRLHGSEPPAS